MHALRTTGDVKQTRVGRATNTSSGSVEKLPVEWVLPLNGSVTRALASPSRE